MADRAQGADLFIVDNADDQWKVRQYLREWAEIAHTVDVATGYIEREKEGNDFLHGVPAIVAAMQKRQIECRVYAQALQQFFRGHELTAGEWENTESEVFPKLDQYQKEGYQALIKMAPKYGGRQTIFPARQDPQVVDYSVSRSSR